MGLPPALRAPQGPQGREPPPGSGGQHPTCRLRLLQLLLAQGHTEHLVRQPALRRAHPWSPGGRAMRHRWLVVQLNTARHQRMLKDMAAALLMAVAATAQGSAAAAM